MWKENGEKMKNLKKTIMVLMAIMLLGTEITAQAASKNVTKQYKSQVSKILKSFDLYLGYSFGKENKFKYDVYTRTTMVYYKNLTKIYGKSINYAKRKCASDMKIYFGNKTMKLKKFSGYGKFKQPSDLIVNKKNKVEYVGGNWGEARPSGKVVKILKNGSKYEVLYDITKKGYSGGRRVPEYDRYFGRFKITLKKARNKYGFIITNMKRIKNAYLYSL